MKELNNTFIPELFLSYYNSHYGKTSVEQADMPLVKEFLQKYGKVYSNIDQASDLMHDFVLLRRGMF